MAVPSEVDLGDVIARQRGVEHFVAGRHCDAVRSPTARSLEYVELTGRRDRAIR